MRVHGVQHQDAAEDGAGNLTVHGVPDAGVHEAAEVVDASHREVTTTTRTTDGCRRDRT